LSTANAEVALNPRTLPIVDSVVLGVFAFVYLGMFLGRIPGLALDRTGVALLGAIVLLATRRVSEQAAVASIDVPTLALLLGMMVVSAQLRLGGFYTLVTRTIASARVSPPALLASLVVAAAVLSALLANDIVCFAMSPIVVETCIRRRLQPVPMLLALACAANVGSAATLIGNPQNMLIGQVLHIGFGAYFAAAAVPTLLGLVIVWAVVVLSYRGRWDLQASPSAAVAVEAPEFELWQSGKGVAVLGLIVVAFVFTSQPRELAPIAAAGVLLFSQKMSTRKMLGLVDWHLLVLFSGLFIVNGALSETGAPQAAVEALHGRGVDLTRSGPLFLVTVALSNIVSNVPAVMLLLPTAKTAAAGGATLALASTLAGNLLLAGSIANLIVSDQAGQLGVKIDWRAHAKIGVPVTLGTLAVAWSWLALTVR
jgi:Na+/H+ antiporter NhaD/arsenite permease-like protein